MLRDDFSSDVKSSKLEAVRLNLEMLSKAKFWLEMISATAKKKDRTKTKSAGGAHTVKIL